MKEFILSFFDLLNDICGYFNHRNDKEEERTFITTEPTLDVNLNEEHD